MLTYNVQTYITVPVVQCQLLERFPVESGAKDPAARMIPFLPGIQGAPASLLPPVFICGSPFLPHQERSCLEGVKLELLLKREEIKLISTAE